ncbi:ras protein [Suillus tomentosus]|nr:ras protein [Suillus tomentosus]
MENWKVVILGDGGVGKTALAIQSYDPTIEDSYRKHLTRDTAGQEEYASLCDQWVRESQGFILVYSNTARSSFEQLEGYQQFLVKVKHQKAIFMLVANKCDLMHDHKVSCREGIILTQKFRCKFLETSARTVYNVEPLFTNIMRALRPTKQIEVTGITRNLNV